MVAMHPCQFADEAERAPDMLERLPLKPTAVLGRYDLEHAENSALPRINPRHRG
jgi:hypothetical protein